jgi:hypothetical protein
MSARSVRLFGAGACPVCSDSGVLVCVKSIATGRLVLFCPLCETAWNDRPVDRRVDSILSLAEVAPDGIVVPAETELIGSPLGPFVEIEGSEWAEMLSPHLQPKV